MEMTKLSRNYSGSCQGNSSNRAFDGLLRSPVSLFRLILHCLLCIAAVTLGYRLSREAHFVIVSYKPPHSSFFLKHVTNLNNTEVPNEVALGFPYARDNPKGFTPSLPPSVGLKSSRVHVGRHEILIRSWPHPDPVQTIVAHRLMDLVQDEQRRIYGLKERKQLLVVTPTYVRTFQAVHLTCLIHTLQVVAGPLIWIVVEAGGVSNETAALLSSSQLSYHHLGIQEAMPVDWEHRQQLKTRLRLEGLRLIREHCLDGIVLFADDSNTYSLDFFDEVQKVDWVGTFSVGLLFYSGLPESSKEVIELPHVHSIVSNETNNQLTHDHLSVAKETDVQLKYDDSNVAKKKSVSRLPPLPLQGPACNLSGHVIGWYAPTKDGHEQEIGTERSFEWAGIALNARMFWEENNTPTWVRSWNELLGVNGTLLESPLAFVKNAAHVEPLGNCGRDVLMWCLQVEAGTSSKFPARWVINPPLDIVVPSKRTPWPDAPVGVPPPPPPPPPPVLLPSDTTNQRGKGRRKGAKGGRRKQGAHHAKQVKGKMEAEQAFQFLGNRTQEK